MSEGAQIALIASIAPTVTALVGVIIALINHRAGDVRDKKLDHITVLTNSTLTQANNRIAVLEGQVSALISRIATLNRALMGTEEEGPS